MTELFDRREAFWRALSQEIKQRNTRLEPQDPTGEYYFKNNIDGGDWHLAFQAKVQPTEEIGCHLVLGHDEAAYESLFQDRDAIHEALGTNLRWKSPKNADTTRFRAYDFERWDILDQSRWDEYIDWLITRGDEFLSVFPERLDRL